MRVLRGKLTELVKSAVCSRGSNPKARTRNQLVFHLWIEARRTAACDLQQKSDLLSLTIGGRHMNRRTLLSFLGFLMLAGSPVYAQSSSAGKPMMPSVDPALFNGLRYRLVGPSRGGRVTTVTGVPSQPKTFYMGVASGGLFRTTDGGTTWVAITDGKVPLGSTGCVAVADSDPNVIYLGTGSDDVRSNVSTGRGVFKTTDGGETWHKVLFVSDSVGAMDLELQPDEPNVVYAWMLRLERKPWTIISGSRDGGFYKSTDGGEHFA